MIITLHSVDDFENFAFFPSDATPRPISSRKCGYLWWNDYPRALLSFRFSTRRPQAQGDPELHLPHLSLQTLLQIRFRLGLKLSCGKHPLPNLTYWLVFCHFPFSLSTFARLLGTCSQSLRETAWHGWKSWGLGKSEMWVQVLSPGLGALWLWASLSFPSVKRRWFCQD